MSFHPQSAGIGLFVYHTYLFKFSLKFYQSSPNLVEPILTSRRVFKN